MKEIIVGIDFSNSSLQAFQYALKVAEACNTSLKLVYVSKQRDKESILIKDEKGMEFTIKENFEKIISQNQEKLNGRISYKILKGKIYEEITNLAKYTEADLIISGAHGMSGFEELWVGNNAMKIIAHSEKPVLCVKKKFRIKQPVIEKIVLVIDHTKESLQKVPFTIQLATFFKAQINVLSLLDAKKTKETEVESNTKKAMEWVISSGLRYINEKKAAESSAKATIEYAIKRNADLISIMTEQDLPTTTLFVSSTAQQIINQSPIPILSFRPLGKPKSK